MPRKLRFQPEEWSTFFVTSRCIQSRFLLRPSHHSNQLIIGVIAKAVKRFDIKLHGLCFMSNHYHLLLSSKNAQVLAQFMQFINGNIAREIGRLHGWREKFWSRRYVASIVLDEHATEERMQYILANSVKEGLVRHPRYWPGVHSYRHLVEGTPLHGIWINRTALHLNPHLKEHEVTEHLSLKLERLPHLAELTEQKHRQLMKALTSEMLESLDVRDKTFIGQKKVLSQNPTDAPRKTSKSPAPLCHTSSVELRRKFKQQFNDFVDAYKQAYEELAKGLFRLEFPEGSIPPTAWATA